MTEMIAHMASSEVQKALNKQSAVGWTPLLIACHKGEFPEAFITLLLIGLGYL